MATFSKSKRVVRTGRALTVAEPKLNDVAWDLPAIPARPVQRQVYRQNPTYSEHSAELELRPQVGRLENGRF